VYFYFILVNGRNSALSLERARYVLKNNISLNPLYEMCTQNLWFLLFCSGVYESEDSELFLPQSEFIVEGLLAKNSVYQYLSS
jgi:hypothetical protein